MDLKFEIAINRLDLLAVPVQNIFKNWTGKASIEEIKVAEIDPKYMAGKDLCVKYNIPFELGANCILIEAVRSQVKQYTACLIPVNAKRTNFNSSVRKFLNARTVSLAPLEEMIALTRMEYGSMTVVGLPDCFQILVDSSIMNLDTIVIGSGLQKSKLLIPTTAILDLTNTHILEGICSIL